MLRPVVFSPSALAHLEALDAYLTSVASTVVAKRWTDSIIACCESLDLFPDRGAPRDDLLQGLRLLGFRRRATIAFVVEPSRVVIVGVFSRGRDVEGWFAGQDDASDGSIVEISREA